MKEGLQLPLPLWQPWPVGLRLRFKLDAVMQIKYRYLRGSPVLVLGPLTWKPEANDWRQYITVFGARWPEDRFGWARPEQLELIPGQPGDPSLQLADTEDLNASEPPPGPLVPLRIL
jgi:hypothetical protein